MQIMRAAFHVFPVLHSVADERAAVLATARRAGGPGGPIEWPCDPPAQGIEHWEAVWRAVAASEPGEPLSCEGCDAEAQARMSALAATARCPVPPRRGDYRLIALLPAPEAVGPDWVRVYLHARRFEMSGELGSAATLIERCAPAAAPLLWHFDAQALVPVSLMPFDDIHPHFFEETVWDDDEGGQHEWHEAEDFSRLPRDPESYRLARRLGPGTKVGGHAAYNAAYMVAPSCPETGQPMTYGLHLAADFFECELGDTGSLHVWLSAGSRAGLAMMDSA